MESSSTETKEHSLWQRHRLPVGVLLCLVTLMILPIFPPHQLHSHIHGGDTLHTVYLTNWGQRTLWTEPWNYFNIPLFDLGEGTKAYTATNPLMEFLTGPLRLLGNPILSYNLMMIANVWLSALNAYLLCFYFAKKSGAAIVGAVIFATNPWMQWHLIGHPNIAAPFAMPLAVYTYCRYRDHPSGKRGAVFCLSLFIQYLASIYLGVILTLAMGCLWLFDILSRARTIQWKRELLFICGISLTLAACFALTIPYQRFSDQVGQTRGLDTAVLFSATIWEYFLPPRWDVIPRPLLGILLADLPLKPRFENVAFAGYTVILLSLFALVYTIRKRFDLSIVQSRTFQCLAVVTLLAVIFSLGPLLWIGNRPSSIKLPYWWIFENMSQLHFLRATARFVVVYLLFVALASALAVAYLQEKTRLGVYTAPLILILVAIEYFPVQPPPRVQHYPEARNVIDRLPATAVVAPYPFGNEGWLPSAASSFPKSPSGSDGGVYLHPYQQLRKEILSRPAPEQLSHLRALGVEYVFAVGQENVELLNRTDHTELLEAWPDGALFDIRDYPTMPDARKASDYPWRPTTQLEDDNRVYTSWNPVRVLVKNPHREWIEFHGDWKKDPIVYTDLSDSVGLVVGGRPMSDFASLEVTFQHNKVGIDYDLAKLHWISRDHPVLEGAPTIRTFVDGGNESQSVRFNLSDHPNYRADDELQAIFLNLPAGTHPHLELRIHQLRIRNVE